MPKQIQSFDDATRKLAKLVKPQGAKRSQTATGGDSGIAGGQRFVNPMDDVGQMIAGGESGALDQVPAGTLGQVATMTDVGAGVLKPRFADPTVGTTPLRYRQPTHASFGGGSYLFDDAGDPVYTLAALET